MKKAKHKNKFSSKRKVNPMSLGGIAAATGSGAMGGAALGLPGMVAGGALGLMKGIMGHQAEKSAEEDQKKQEEMAKVSSKQAELSGYTSGGGKLINSAGGEVNPYALAYGGFNPSRNLEEYNTGGTHEQNPNGGIQVGYGSNGQPNTVEENETSFNIGGEKFIFSDRVQFKTSDDIPKFVKGSTYADASKSIEKAFFGRNDKYSMDTKKTLIQRLAASQEQVKQKTEKTSQQSNQSNQFSGGGLADPFANININTNTPTIDENLIKRTELEEVPVYSNSQDPWSKRNQDKIETGMMVAGIGSQLAGVVSNIRNKNQIREAETIQAQTVDSNTYTPNLVNRQDILRGVTNAQQNTIGALGARASGNFGAFAANVAGVQSNTSKAVSSAMLQADQLDSAELARVQQGRAEINQFNALSQYRVDIANEQNLAAVSQQKALYSQGIAANIGSLGTSLMNYVLGTKTAKYKGDSIIADSFTNTEEKKNR